MRQEIIFTENDRIAVIAPHPDDECLGVSAALLLAPDRTDIFVLSDGSHGCKERTIEEEATVRIRQFENEMAIVKPHSWHWFGAEDTKLNEHKELGMQIDFTPYTKIFLPWLKSLHPDHVAAAEMCIDAIRRQQAKGECWFYEICAPFHNPTHYIDITAIEEGKRKLVRCHKDQSLQERTVLSLNAFRAAQMHFSPQYQYVECYEKVNTE